MKPFAYKICMYESDKAMFFFLQLRKSHKITEVYPNITNSFIQ